jgi:hypothetical protein
LSCLSFLKKKDRQDYHLREERQARQPHKEETQTGQRPKEKRQTGQPPIEKRQ